MNKSRIELPGRPSAASRRASCLRCIDLHRIKVTWLIAVGLTALTMSCSKPNEPDTVASRQSSEDLGRLREELKDLVQDPDFKRTSDSEAWRVISRAMNTGNLKIQTAAFPIMHRLTLVKPSYRQIALEVQLGCVLRVPREDVRARELHVLQYGLLYGVEDRSYSKEGDRRQQASLPIQRRVEKSGVFDPEAKRFVETTMQHRAMGVKLVAIRLLLQASIGGASDQSWAKSLVDREVAGGGSEGQFWIVVRDAMTKGLGTS